jgi:hypothetical protein
MARFFHHSKKSLVAALVRAQTAGIRFAHIAADSTPTSLPHCPVNSPGQIPRSAVTQHMKGKAFGGYGTNSGEHPEGLDQGLDGFGVGHGATGWGLINEGMAPRTVNINRLA